jgi:2-polyprenyl-3-methyl-5-hydroxy-6-metoxy-1,4-benzoquinol methylase/ribosomal protein S27E
MGRKDQNGEYTRVRFEKIDCPNCHSTDAVRFTKRADIVTCRSCGITYLRTRPTQESMYRMIYQKYANETSYMRLPDDITKAKVSGLRRPYLVDEITRLHAGGRKGVWLDVGCGWGALLDEARDRGYTPRGIEITRNSLDFAVMQLNIPVSNSQFPDSAITPHSCSIVSMSHVLEHLPDPKQAIKKTYEILEEGGMFCGIAPNIASLSSAFLKDDWVWLDPVHHYVHYSPETLTRLLEEAGFTVERMYTAIGDYDYNAVLENILRTMPEASSLEQAQELIPGLMAAGKGEEIRFFARKPLTAVIQPDQPAKQSIVPVTPVIKERPDQQCPCCQSEKTYLLRKVYEYDYFQCATCDCLFIDIQYLQKIDEGFNIVKYEEGYWKMELSSARERSYGPALARMAEAVYYCKIPVQRFLDIGTGPGYFLDAVCKLLPDHANVFYGVELFPPDPEFRTSSPNYFIGDLGDLKDKFDCGICIEVIEHLTPRILDGVLRKLASVSNPGALYIFNTGMPPYVLHEDPGYLDPVKRGHLVSYSIKAMSILGGKYGFIAHPIPGKTWAFALEYVPDNPDLPPEDIRDRIWHALPQNLEILHDETMGDVLKILGSETSRAYH